MKVQKTFIKSQFFKRTLKGLGDYCHHSDNMSVIEHIAVLFVRLSELLYLLPLSKDIKLSENFIYEELLIFIF